MTTYKAQLKDDNGNVVYPDVGIDLDNVVTTGQGNPTTPTPWVQLSDIIWSSVIDKIYPVGSIFMSATLSTAAAVGNALGGTWIAWGAGRVPVGVGTVEDNTDDWCGHTSAGDWTAYGVELKGGEMRHTLSVGEIPRHRHYVGVRWSTEAGAGYMYGSDGTGGGGDYDNITGFAGGGEAHNNLPPYITCYMYKRTA